MVDATAGYDNACDELFGYNVVDDAFQIFSADSIKLGPSLNLFNVCLSAALTAYLEATCVDDAFKNSLCYFVRGEHLKFSHKTLPALMYFSTKNMDALEKCHPAATMFVLKSRLFDAAPMHHGGLLKFLWAMFGPLAIKAKGQKFLKKVDAGGLSPCGSRQCVLFSRMRETPRDLISTQAYPTSPTRSALAGRSRQRRGARSARPRARRTTRSRCGAGRRAAVARRSPRRRSSRAARADAYLCSLPQTPSPYVSAVPLC